MLFGFNLNSINSKNMKNEDKHIENLENDEINGKNILGGGAGEIDNHELPAFGFGAAKDEAGMQPNIINLEAPEFETTRVATGDDAPPILNNPGMDSATGYNTGNI
jgi:hypothetical protein